MEEPGKCREQAEAWYGDQGAKLPIPNSNYQTRNHMDTNTVMVPKGARVNCELQNKSFVLRWISSFGHSSGGSPGLCIRGATRGLCRWYLLWSFTGCLSEHRIPADPQRNSV